MKIVKSLTPNLTDKELEQDCNTVNYCSWQRLMPYLKEAAHLSATEYIKGVKFDKDGIDIIIGKRIM